MRWNCAPPLITQAQLVARIESMLLEVEQESWTSCASGESPAANGGWAGNKKARSAWAGGPPFVPTK